MVLSIETNETAITLWVAFCSNRERSLDMCLQKTQETLTIGASELMAEWIGRELHTVYLNRGRDTAFLQQIFTEDSPELAIGCVRAALDARMQGDNVDVDSFFTEYVARYGEDPVLLASRLRWLTLYANYTEHAAEVERIMATLTSTPGETL